MRNRISTDRRMFGALFMLALAGCGGSSAARTATPAPTATSPPFVPGSLGVSVLPSTGPRILSGKFPAIAMHLSVRGLHLDTRNMGASPISRHGHVQVYLDRVPKDAYTKADLKGVVANIASPVFSMGLSPRLVAKERGPHRLYVTLARNDDVLYRVKPAVVTVTFR